MSVQLASPHLEFFIVPKHHPTQPEPNLAVRERPLFTPKSPPIPALR